MSVPDTLSTHQSRWAKALAGRQKWTREAWIDRLVAANKGWSPDELDTFWGQNREPSNYPIIHPVIESVCGLEAQTRRDTTILARSRDHMDTAEALTALLKYVDQQNKTGFVRSKAFRHAAGADGVGILETFYSEDPHAETIGKRSVDPMHIWFDPAGREDDLSDHQDIFRARWLPKAWVDMRFERARSGGGQFSPVFAYDPLSHTQNYHDQHGDEPPVSLFNGAGLSDPNYGPGHGIRAPLMGMGWATQDADTFWRIDRYADLHLVVERWYRADEWANYVILRDGRVIEATKETARRCAPMVLAGEGQLRRALARRVRQSIFIADTAAYGAQLQDVESPYSHGDFPFTPTWGYRDEEGQPMGIVRLLRDPAREFNMRRTYLTKISMMRQTHVETGAFEDEDDAIRELSKPNGVVRYNPGMMEKARTDSLASLDAGMAQLQDHLLTGSLQMVQNLGPVNQEALGQETNAKSGVAIENRQQQAQVALFHLFDNRNWAQQRESEQTLALIQDSYTEEKEIRITGSSRGLEYLHINKQDPTKGVVLNDISQGRYDVIVQEQPEAPTVRAAKLQAIGQLMQGADLPPQVRMKLVIAIAEGQDLPVEVLETLHEAAQMLAQPQPPQQQVRKSLDEIVKIAMPDLTPMERAQVLQAVGIQPDPNGPPQAAQEGAPAQPQLSPDALLSHQAALAQQQAQHAHDAGQAAADRQHELMMAQLQGQQQSQATDQQHQNALEQGQQAADLAPPPAPPAGGSD